MAKSLVHRKTAAALDGAREQITLRLLVSNAKRTIAELAAAEGRLLSVRNEILGRAWRLGKLLAAHKRKGGARQIDDWLPSNFHEIGKTNSARIDNAAR